MKRSIPLALMALALLVSSCKGTQSDETEVVASVGEQELMRTEVVGLIPRGISSADSMLFAESYIKKWMKDRLVYDVALRNLGDEQHEIDKLVEDYRHSLIQYRYQERLVKERLEAEIRESDKLRYYEENENRFVLDKSLIKGLFLKIPADAPNLKNVKTWYKQTTDEALEKIEKYSLQNANIYDYFYDRWVDFDEVMDNIPMHISDPARFLEANKVIEVTDSSYCYLLNIKEYLAAGTVAPYDYALPQVTEILINQRKVDFIKDFEESIYNEAIRNGKAKRYTDRIN